MEAVNRWRIAIGVINDRPGNRAHDLVRYGDEHQGTGKIRNFHPANRLEALSGNRKGQHSIRINQQWRICFRWEACDAYDVEIVDYH